MKLRAQIALHAFGTPEGAEKGWDTRGRGRNVGEAVSNSREANIRQLLRSGRTQGLEAKVIYRPVGSDQAVVDVSGVRFAIDNVRRLVNLGVSVTGKERVTRLPNLKTQRDVAEYFKSFPKLSAEDFALNVKADAAGNQTGGSSLIGRKYQVRDTRYGYVVSEHDFPDEAENAARARPYSKVVSWQKSSETPSSRDRARQRLVITNPDVT